MVAFDTCVLSLFVYEDTSPPGDFAKDGKPIPFAAARVNRLIEDLSEQGETILIGTPVLAEVLVRAGEEAELYLNQILSQSCFQICHFDARAAVEVAMRTKEALNKGDKTDGCKNWQKVKVDRQLLAIAKVEEVTKIYSTDEDVHKLAKTFGIVVENIVDLPMPKDSSVQLNFFEEDEVRANGNEQNDSSPADSQRSADRPNEGEAKTYNDAQRPTRSQSDEDPPAQAGEGELKGDVVEVEKADEVAVIGKSTSESAPPLTKEQSSGSA